MVITFIVNGDAVCTNIPPRHSQKKINYSEIRSVAEAKSSTFYPFKPYPQIVINNINIEADISKKNCNLPIHFSRL
jgi:hypothetical protein